MLLKPTGIANDFDSDFSSLSKLLRGVFQLMAETESKPFEPDSGNADAGNEH